MNEQKKSNNDYIASVSSDTIQNAQELYSIIYAYMKNTELKPADFMALNTLLKKLKNTDSRLPRKVLRGMANKFDNICKNYQR